MSVSDEITDPPRALDLVRPLHTLDELEIAARDAGRLVLDGKISRGDASADLRRISESAGLLAKHGEKIIAERIAAGFERARLEKDNDELDARVVDEEDELGAEANSSAPPGSEENLALRFAEMHEHNLRYVAVWGRWKIFNRQVWETDDTLAAFDLVRRHCRASIVGYDEKDARLARALASASSVAAVERLARADRRLAATTDQWDADPWLLNTPEGVIDLKTGEVSGVRADDFLTKITSVSRGAHRRQWNEFLQHITDGDQELQAFLQRMCGYCLTGVTNEHALFFLYGTGGNGKGVFLNTVSDILAGYHRTASIETFTASNVDRHPTDLAYLLGSRMVTAVETEEGRRWAESRIKTLTGGDKISARFMRQDFFEFTPQFKLVIAGNHKPGLRSVDEAIRRRFHLLPFRVTIPPEQRDKSLAARLKEEWPGIFTWMVEGCLDWQSRGLSPPTTVINATATYLQEEDAVAAWVAECCEVGPDLWDRSGHLYASWKVWAEGNGEPVGTQTRLTRNLQNWPGFGPNRDSRARGTQGLRVISDG